MKAYNIKNKRKHTFWTVQLPVSEQLDDEEVVAEADISEDFLKEITDEDKNYLILELAQMIRLNNVEERIATEKSKSKGKARKTIGKKGK